MIKRIVSLFTLVFSTIFCVISCDSVSHYTFKMCTLALESGNDFSLVKYSPQFILYVPKGKKLSPEHFATRLESVNDTTTSLVFEGKTYRPVNSKFWVVNEKVARDMPTQSFSDLLINEDFSKISADSPWSGKVNFVSVIDTFYADEVYFGAFPYFLPNNTYLIINTYEVIQQ